MPKHVQARVAQDEQEERQLRKLARSHHAPADWKFHAQMVIESWAGKTPKEIAIKLECHPKTVRTHLRRFNAQGIEGLGMRAGSGRKPRLTEQEREPRFSDWSNSRHPDGWRGARMAHWSREMSRDQPSGVWMPSRKPPKKRASASNAVRSGASSCVKECAGATRTVGGPATSRSPSQKNGGRHPLHRAARRVDDRLHRRTRASSSPHLSPSTRLVYQWTSHQSTDGLQSRSPENLGLWSAARARWQGTDPMRRLAQLDELHRSAACCKSEGGDGILFLRRPWHSHLMETGSQKNPQGPTRGKVNDSASLCITDRLQDME